MERVEKIKVALMVVTIISFLASTNSAIAKSVYAITDHDASTLKAYKIQGNQLQEQANVYATNDDAGGITIDSNLELLFITYEGSAKIVWINAKTLEQEGFIDLREIYSSAGELSGIVADETKQRVYVVERNLDKLYILAWNAGQKKLILMDPQNPNQPYTQGDPYVTLSSLPYGAGAWGIALDENTRRLYVANNTNNVHIYNADDINWTHLGTRDVGRIAMGIAVDPNNGQHPAYLYIDGFQAPGGGFHTFLVKHNLETQTNPNTEQNIGTVATGLAVDVDTGLVYVTTTDRQVRVYNCSSYPFIQTYSVSTGVTQSGPAGICVPTGDVSYKPAHFLLTKDDNIPEGNCVLPDDYITYTISYDANGHSDSNVMIVDRLPQEVDYNSSSPLGNYNEVERTVSWNLPTVLPDDNGTFTLTVQVNELAEPLGTITNLCEIEGDSTYNVVEINTPVCAWNPGVIYVDDNAPGSNTGMSWHNAYRDLQDALARARAGCGSEIWVAAGTYRPSERTDPCDPSSATFALIDGVAIYGGFNGSETVRYQRNWLANQTILNGDIDNDGTGEIQDVVIASSVGQTAIIDGFTITKGYWSGLWCDGASPMVSNCLITQNGNDESYGGGMCCVSSASPQLINCTFSDNLSYYGGGMHSDFSSPNLTNCIFSNNTATFCGGGMDNYQSPSVIVTNCIFNNNHAGSYGGGISNYLSSPTVVNCTFSKNSADYGGALYNENNSSPNVTNCILWADIAYTSGNEIHNFNQTCVPNFSFCDIQGGWLGLGQGNIDVYPNFFDAGANNFHLSPDGSPCIDAGTNTPIGGLPPTDIDGEKRVVDGDSNGSEIVDMGADEYYWSPADFNNPDSRDGLVNFIDYAIFANAWDSNTSDSDWNHDYDLAADGVINYYDLDLFCEDWLWQAGWSQQIESMIMGQGMGQAMAAGFAPTATSQSVLAEQQIEKVEPLKIEEIIDRLEQIWLDPEVQRVIDKGAWLRFIESLMEEIRN